jgi:hypothetical protein
MSTLANIYIKLEMLETLVSTLKTKNEKGISIDISINDTTNNYGQNLSGYVSQSIEQRNEKKPKYYVGNGKVFWTDGKITTAKKPDEQPAQTHTPQASYDAVPIKPEPVNDLPF